MNIEETARLVKCIEILELSAARGTAVRGWRLTALPGDYTFQCVLLNGVELKGEGKTMMQACDALANQLSGYAG